MSPSAVGPQPTHSPQRQPQLPICYVYPSRELAQMGVDIYIYTCIIYCTNGSILDILFSAS